MKILQKLILIILGIFVSFMVGRVIQKPYVEGKLDVKSNGVYLSDIPVEFEASTEYMFTAWKRNSSKELKDPQKEPGYVINFLNSNDYDNNERDVKIPKMTVPINVKFDHLKGKISILDNSIAPNSQINITIEGDNGKVLWNSVLSASSKTSLDVDIPLNKQRKLKISANATKMKKGQKIYLGLVGFSLTKDGAKVDSFDYIQNPNLKWEPPYKKLLFSPKFGNDQIDIRYISSEVKNPIYGSDVKLIRSSIYLPEDSSKEYVETIVLPLNKYGKNAFAEKDILVKGGTATVKWDAQFKKCKISNIKVDLGQVLQVYIPKGTIVNDVGYKLHQDYVIADIHGLSDMPKAKSAYTKYVLVWTGVIALIVFGLFLLFISEGSGMEIDSTVGMLSVTILPLAVFALLMFFPNMVSGSYDTVKNVALWCNILASLPMALILFCLITILLGTIANNGVIWGSILCILEIAISIFLILIGLGFIGMAFGVLFVLVKGIFGD